MFKIISSFYLLLCFFNTYAQKQIHKLENGDLIFQNSECGPLCIAINKVTPAIYGKHYSHIGIIDIENDTTFVIEATGNQVQKNTIKFFLARSKQTVLVGRLKKQYKYLIPQAIQYSQQQIGVPYDDNFIYNNGKYYCSELIYDAFKSANHEKAFFQLFPMTFKEPKSKVFFPGWVKYYKNRGMAVPEGKLGCNPGGIGQSKKLEIYSYQ